MKNVLSVLPILSAVSFVVHPPNETGTEYQEDDDISVSSVTDRLFDLTNHHEPGRIFFRFIGM